MSKRTERSSAADDLLARELLNALGAGAGRAARSASGSHLGDSTESGRTTAAAARGPRKNPMSGPGQMIYGGKGGAEKALAAPASAAVILRAESDGAGGFRPVWGSETVADEWTQEELEDLIAASLVAGAGISVSYDDGTGDITITNTNPTPLVGSAAGISAHFDGNGSAVPASQHVLVQVPYGATVSNWYANADQSGSIAWTVERATQAAPGAWSTISTGGHPTISAAQFASGSTSGWAAATLAAGDWLRLTVNGAATSITYAGLALRFVRT